MCGNCTCKTVLTDVDGNFVGVTNGNLDVLLGDQTSPFGSLPAFLHKTDQALTTEAVIDTYTFDVAGGHDIIVGDFLVLKSAPYSNSGYVVNVAVNTITMDSPFPRTFPIGSIVEHGSTDAALNGSVTRQILSVSPPAGVQWDITKISILIVDDAPMDVTLFGGIAALLSGIVIRKKNTIHQNMFNFKSNGDIVLTTSHYAFDQKAPAGKYSFAAEIHLSGQAEFGVAVRLDGDLGDEIELIIQDDLTALDSLIVQGHGHIVV
jgi:hypothetical protein